MKNAFLRGQLQPTEGAQVHKGHTLWNAATFQDLKKQLPCAAYIDGEYGVKDIYAGVPVIIGAKGVEKVIELKLSDEENKNFNNSIKAVRELFGAAKKIDSSL